MQSEDHKSNDILIHEIADRVADIGGSVYYVGGFVRDRLLGIENKDVDIEVHGVTPAQLEAILDSIGERITIGESFGIYGLKGYDLDIAMPRKETNRGSGHRDFDVCVDPFAGTLKASERRDFTINALMENVLTGEIVDHWGGQADLEKGIIRHINNMTFAEDPLRVLRAAQFAARFEFEVAPETVKICSTMDLSSLASERVWGELSKALLKAHKPSIFFETLRQMNQLSVWFPEVEALIGVPQNPRYHAEGDVWVHTMMVLDSAVRYVHEGRVSNSLAFMLSALCHDFGKVVATEFVNGAIHAYGHEIKGLPIVKIFLTRLTNEKDIIRYVLNMTELHMKPNSMASANSSIKKTNRMFDESIDPEGLICMALSDSDGQVIGDDSILSVSGTNETFLYERMEIYIKYMSCPYVTGKDLVEAGVKPGKQMGELLEYAHKLRLAGVKKDVAIKQVISFAQKKASDMRSNIS